MISLLYLYLQHGSGGQKNFGARKKIFFKEKRKYLEFTNKGGENMLKSFSMFWKKKQQKEQTTRYQEQPYQVASLKKKKRRIGLGNINRVRCRKIWYQVIDYILRYQDNIRKKPYNDEDLVYFKNFYKNQPKTFRYYYKNIIINTKADTLAQENGHPSPIIYEKVSKVRQIIDMHIFAKVFEFYWMSIRRNILGLQQKKLFNNLKTSNRLDTPKQNKKLEHGKTSLTNRERTIWDNAPFVTKETKINNILDYSFKGMSKKIKKQEYGLYQLNPWDDSDYLDSSNRSTNRKKLKHAAKAKKNRKTPCQLYNRRSPLKFLNYSKKKNTVKVTKPLISLFEKINFPTTHIGWLKQQKNILLPYFFFNDSLSNKYLISSHDRVKNLNRIQSRYTLFNMYYSLNNKNFFMDYINFLYYQNYFTVVLKLPVVFKPINSRKILSPKLMTYMLTVAQTIPWKQYKIIHFNEIIEILLICICLRNLKLFINWVRSMFEKNRLSTHRKIFSLLNILLSGVIWTYNIFFGIKGLKLIIAGKIGKAGSVRKSKLYIRRGKISYTSKNLGLVSSNCIIRTFTGVLSLKFEVFF